VKDTSHAQLLRESLGAIERLERRLEQSEAAKHEPIAIVGAGCRYPGGVETPEDLWRNLRDGVDAVRDVPGDRWDADAYYSADRQAPGKMITRRGGFLTQVDRFEPQLFGISPREASTMDPQQRLLLETAYEALESAAIAPDRLAGSQTGVFVGITTSDYGLMQRQMGPESSDVYSATGSALNAAAGRISFTFGFQGPCVAVDTACSSSLVAVHLACQSLRAGECTLALAGGVNVVLLPDAMVLFSKWGMLAPDGHCKTFDATADGFVRGEGCAVLALRRLSDALAAGDPILGVIRGSAINSDGRSSGLTVPSGPAQRQVLQSALANARLEASDIDYVEAHGTGTPLGDPIEVEALGAVLGRGHSTERPLLIGSVKTGLGHTEAASGVAGLLKVVMALEHEAIPPHLHFSRPNPGIPWDRLPLKVATGLTPWPRAERARRAGVSSFGFSGTNAHVILEEAPVPAAVRAPEDRVTLVPLSAREEKGLRALAARLAEFVAKEPDVSLADVARTLGSGRSHLSERAALVVDSKASLVTELGALAAGRAPSSGAAGRLNAGERFKVAFLFTGQGAQYVGMGRGLYASEPVFREALDRAAAILARRLDRPLIELLFGTEGGASPLSQTAYTQPALFALEYALAELWASFGVTPAVVLGHSVGEYVAATVAGAMTLEEGLTLITERGRLMQALPAGGTMAAVFANADEVSRRVERTAGRVSVAAFNGPEETVVSGDAPAVAELCAAATADGIQSRQLDVSHAFHSHRLDPMLDALERSASAVRFAPPRVPLVSNLTGAPFPSQSAPDATYFRRHAREPVRFLDSIAALRGAGVNALVEIGPHPTLLGLVARATPGASWSTAASLRRGRDDSREMLGALGTLYTRGAPVAWDAVRRSESARRVALPTYPFQRERHWFAKSARAEARAAQGHPLLGVRRDLASAPGTHTWETTLSLESHPWLTDHRVQGEAIVPATAFIEIGLAAGAEVLGHGAAQALRVDQINNKKPLLLRDGEERTVQTTLTVEPDGRRARLSVSSASKGSPWVEHATASIAKEDALDAASKSGLEAAARERCAAHVDGASFYETLARAGNQWGESFQGLREAWLGENEAVARVEPPAAVAAETGRYRFHPALSDSCGHCLVAVVSNVDARRATNVGAFVGGGVEAIRFHRPPSGARLWVHAELRPNTGETRDRVVVGDVRVYDETGIVSETLGARLVYLDVAAGPAVAGRDWYYEVRWVEREAPKQPESASAGTWLILADRGGVAEALAERRRAAGGKALLVKPGSGFSLDGDRATLDVTDRAALGRLLEQTPGASAILHVCSLGASAGEALRLGPESAVAVLEALVAQKGSRPARLWLVTADSQQARAEDACSAPFAALLWGLGRSLSAEHAELWGGLVDLASGAPPSELARDLERELAHSDDEDQVAWRDGRRYAPRLARRAPAEPHAGTSVSADGAYLVTGGLGGIGLAVAGWLVARGARHVVLVGRTPLPPRERWAELEGAATADARRVAAVRELEASGARIETVALDIGADGALEAWLAARRKRGEPPLRGIVHAAGVLEFKPLAEESAESLRRMLAPKVAGAWRLHAELATEPLDWFVACSSTSALLRSPLLGAYAAGNAFLDALAHHRRAKGLPALSINWGTWGEVGMAADAERARGGGLMQGMSAMSTAAALSALDELVANGAVQACVMPVDWQRLAHAYPAFGKDPFLRELVDVSDTAAPARGRNGATISALRAADDATRPQLLVGYLREEAARTLGMRPDDVDPAVSLSSIGFDSLMAVQLKSQIEADLGVVVPMIRFLEGPSLNQIMESLVDAGRALAAPPSEAAGNTWEEGSI